LKILSNPLTDTRAAFYYEANGDPCIYIPVITLSNTTLLNSDSIYKKRGFCGSFTKVTWYANVFLNETSLNTDFYVDKLFHYISQIVYFNPSSLSLTTSTSRI
jgi:hypothetical protein